MAVHAFFSSASFGDSLNVDEVKTENIEKEVLPERFDARQKWKDCKIISNVWNQGPCASCWAISTANMISDRICIITNGSMEINLSVEQLLSCCSNCSMLNGCKGGDPRSALWYYYIHGLVTGGRYDSNQGCQPYSLPPCEVNSNSTLPICSDSDYETPVCFSNCTNHNYPISYFEDTYRAAAPPYRVNVNEEEIKNELYINGPTVVIFQVHTDFMYYRNGIYHSTNCSKPIMWHSAKLIGWGNENNTPYWLVLNSWGSEWGENGTFRFIRGINECCFECHIFGITPKTYSSYEIF